MYKISEMIPDSENIKSLAITKSLSDKKDCIKQIVKMIEKGANEGKEKIIFRTNSDINEHVRNLFRDKGYKWRTLKTKNKIWEEILLY